MTNFLPFRVASIPAGTAHSPKARAPQKGMSPPWAEEMPNTSLAMPTKLPRTSPKPITKKTSHSTMMRMSMDDPPRRVGPGRTKFGPLPDRLKGKRNRTLNLNIGQRHYNKLNP